VDPLRRSDCLFGLFQHLPRGLPKSSSRLRELHTPLGALDEQDPQLIFELANLLAKRGLR